MMVVAAVVTFLSLAAYLTSQFGRYAGRQQTVDMQAAYCDAALEYAYALWKKTASAYALQVQTNALAPTGATVNKLLQKSIDDFRNTSFPYDQQLGVDPTSLTFSIQAVDQNGLNDQTIVNNATTKPVIGTTDVTDSNGAPLPVLTKNVPNYPGWIGYTYNYLATVSVKSVGYGMLSGGETYQARRYFQVIYLPLCQNLGFYQGVMEIHPGATMILNGKIHSNKDIYAQGYGAYLQFLNNVSYVGSYNDGSSNPAVTKGWDGSNTGKNNPDAYRAYFPDLYKDALPLRPTPNAQDFSGSTVDPSSGVSSEYATQVNQVSPVDPFGGQSANQNGLHDIVEVPTSSNASSGAVVYNNAALVVEVDSTGLGATAKLIPKANITVQVADGSGNLQPANSTDYANVYAAINSGAITPMWDKRENSTAMLTNLDMGLLDKATTMPAVAANATPLQKAFNQSKNADGTWAQGGTVYIHDKALKTAATRPAIRLTNGRNLGENVSIASDNGVYVQGDYNTGGTVYTDVPTNKSGTSRQDVPQAPGYNRYSSSVMADAVTILSNNWNDKNASTALSTRTATPTTVNVAILAGDVASNTGNNGIASGGLHNFPRFLENWKNINFTYYGSLIEAFNSEEYTGNWQTNDVYYWPNRLWSFDTNFLVAQPPGMPQGVVLSRGRWERFFGGANNG